MVLKQLQLIRPRNIAKQMFKVTLKYFNNLKHLNAPIYKLLKFKIVGSFELKNISGGQLGTKVPCFMKNSVFAPELFCKCQFPGCM